MSYEFHRGFFDIVMRSYADLPESECAKSRIGFIARSSVMKYVFNGLYLGLIRKKELMPIHEQPKEHQDELWGIAEEFLPPSQYPVEDQGYFLQALCAFLWLLNN